MVKPIPDGYHSVTPYLIVDDAKAAIDFYGRAFGATEKMRLPMGNRIGHAELNIGDSIIMLADEFPEMGHLSPKSRGGTTVSLLHYVEDVDAAWKRAIDAGATEFKPLENQFWGDRMGTLTDPFGHRWSLASAVEEVSPEEMQRRMEQFGSSKQQPEPA
ncbi:MAG TPA: VOC family protein [Sphingomicrobium sp.]|nr:VOC family protein [Sphingomicrobium sp.]